METDQNPKFRDMKTSIVDDIISLVKGHVELAKLELQQSAKSVAVSIVAFVVTLAMINLGVILLFVAGAFGIYAAGLPLWASFLIVSVSLFFFGLLTALIGVSKLKKATSPGKSVEALSSTLEGLRGLISGRKA